jgi:hypothetical protein
VTEELAAGHDLLVCGVPEKAGLLPQLPEGMAVTRTGFAVEHESFTAPDDALFAVAARPSGPERVTALFVPLSARAADACVTRISHYGKYGYLVFSGGQNRIKGMQPAAGGRTTVNF